MRSKVLIGISFGGMLNFSSGIGAEKLNSDSIKVSSLSELSLSTNYYTNSNSFGTVNNLVVEPFGSFSLSYYGKKGLNLSASALFIGNSDTSNIHTTSEYDLGIGYQLSFLEYFTVTPSYTHYFYSKNSSSLKSGVNNSLLLDLTGTVKWWSVIVNGGYSWGNVEDFYLSVGTNVALTLHDVLGKGNTLTCLPTGTLNFGNWDFYNFYGKRLFKFLSSYAKNHPNITANQLMEAYDSNSKLPVVQLMKNHPVLYNRLKKLSPDEKISELFEKNPRFSLSSVSLTLPVSYSVKNFVFNIGVSAGKPVNQPRYISSDWVTYFSLGLSYSFNF